MLLTPLGGAASGEGPGTWLHLAPGHHAVVAVGGLPQGAVVGGDGELPAQGNLVQEHDARLLGGAHCGPWGWGR